MMISLSIFCCLSLPFITSPVLLVEAQRESVTNNTNLKLALNAALMSVIQSGDAQELMALAGNHHRLSTVCNAQGTYSFPLYSELPPGDGLKAVLDTETLYLHGVGPANWGEDGDYTAASPTGFWPDYLTLVVEKLNGMYAKKINVVRTYEKSAPDVGGSVPLGVDSSDMYFLLNGLAELADESTSVTRALFYDVTCAAAIVDSLAIVRSADDIVTFDALITFLEEQESPMMGAVSEANRDVVKLAFPAKVNWMIFENGNEELAKAVEAGTVHAGITTGRLGTLLEAHNLVEIPSGLPSYYGFMTRYKSAASSLKVLVPLLVPVLATFSNF